MSSRGDCRIAVDICRQALDAQIEKLNALSESWSINDNFEASDVDLVRQISTTDVNKVCSDRELDPELGKSTPSRMKVPGLVAYHAIICLTDDLHACPSIFITYSPPCTRITTAMHAPFPSDPPLSKCPCNCVTAASRVR